MTSPDEQAQLIRETNNGPRLDNEEEILREVFGEPNANGVYGALTQEGEE